MDGLDLFGSGWSAMTAMIASETGGREVWRDVLESFVNRDGVGVLEGRRIACDACVYYAAQLGSAAIGRPT